jgi:hypothetical protein
MRKRAQYVDENDPENHPNNAESKKKDVPIGTLHGGKVHPLLCQNLLDALNVINSVCWESDTSSSEENQPSNSMIENGDYTPHMSDESDGEMVNDNVVSEVEATNARDVTEIERGFEAEDAIQIEAGDTPESNVGAPSQCPPQAEDENGSSSPASETAVDNANNEAIIEPGRNETSNVYGSDQKPKTNSYIMFKEFDEDWLHARVLSTQPKRKGVHRDWVNMQIEGREEPCSQNWAKVEEWKVIEATEHPIFFTVSQELSPEVAKDKELSNLKRNAVYEIVDDNGQETISSRWVFTEKDTNGERTVKARMVDRGFEEDSELLGIRTDSPTCNKHSLRLVMVSTVICPSGTSIQSILQQLGYEK